ncbi:hypothetical protein NKH93_32460 [Mesorhizobium sp. M0954]
MLSTLSVDSDASGAHIEITDHELGRFSGSSAGVVQKQQEVLRASFAVHRLAAWYRAGADVQRLLPQLSTYLGHVHIAGRQRYLALTPDLLCEASIRFERYAMEVLPKVCRPARRAREF